jgi:hypothetical protein
MADACQRSGFCSFWQYRFKGARAESKGRARVHKKHPRKIGFSPLSKASPKILHKKLLIFMQAMESLVCHEEKNLHLRTG